MKLHDYQQHAVKHALNSKAQYTLIASPTGTGKSYMELVLQDALPGSWIVTPKIEIIRGLLAKRGLAMAASLPLTQLIATGLREKITTPIRLRDMLIAGECQSIPTALIWDEVHHHEAESWQLIDIACGVRSVGFTATPYRGTPKSSAAFRERWGEPYWAITMRDAVAQRRLKLPSIRTVPLIDDDIIDVVNGDFKITSLDSATMDRLDDAVDLIKNLCYPDSTDTVLVDMPTMVAVPSTRVANELADRLVSRGVPADCVLQDTTPVNRVKAFEQCIRRQSVLIQIDVVSEGVDLPVRRLIDLRPTQSPVRWLQQFGRITRPTDDTPEYICCNRNLLRHCYLLEGCIPSSVVLDSQDSFPPSARTLGMRAVGLESLGRFKPVEIRLTSGLKCVLYILSTLEAREGTNLKRRVSYAVLLHPMLSEPLVARRFDQQTGQVGPGDTAMDYGKWHEVHGALSDLSGFASKSPSAVSPKQAIWWERSAANHGIDPTQKLDAKVFQVLPILSNLRKVIR